MISKLAVAKAQSAFFDALKTGDKERITQARIAYNKALLASWKH